jgi:hypothetical protein
MENEEKNGEISEEPQASKFLKELSEFLKEHPEIKEGFAKIISEYPKGSRFQFSARMALIAGVIAGGFLLAYVGKITGDTLSGFIGVIIGYLMGREKL